MNALRNQRLDSVLDAVLPAAIPEIGRHLPGQANAAIGFPQEQRRRVRGDGAPVERRCDFPASEAGEIEVS